MSDAARQFIRIAPEALDPAMPRSLMEQRIHFIETVRKVGGAMGPPGRCNLGFGMKWRVMLELVGSDGTVSFMRLVAGRRWQNMRRR